jgi:hypothetical protein
MANRQIYRLSTFYLESLLYSYFIKKMINKIEDFDFCLIINNLFNLKDYYHIRLLKSYKAKYFFTYLKDHRQ